jgi:hypothetical protein
MQPLRELVTYPDDFSVLRSSFFGRPPLRSYRFIAGTLILLLNLAVVAFVVVRNWNTLPAFVIMWIGMATAMMMLWTWGVYQIWQRLYELYSEAKLDSSFARSPVDRVFGLAGVLISATMFWPIAAALIFLLAFGGLSIH